MPLSKPDQLPEPAATGSLGKKPLAHLLIYAIDRKLSGTFELAADAGASVHVVVNEGLVLRVATSEHVAYLGHILYELGAIDDAMLSISLAEVAATKKLHGQVLKEREVIKPEQLAEGLRIQRMRKLQHAFGLPPKTTFAFYPDVDLVGERPDDVEAMEPLTGIWRAVREHPSWDHVRATITRVGGRPLRLLATSAVDKLGLEEDERAAAECLRMKPSTIPELAIIGGLTIQSTDLLAYFLVIAKQVELVERTGTSAAPGAMPSAAPAAMPSGAPAARATNPPVRVNTPGVQFASGEYKRKISFSMSAVSPESGTVRIPSPLPPDRVPSPIPGRVSSHPGRSFSPMPGRLSSPLPPRVPSQAPGASSPPLPGSVAPPPASTRGASQPPASSPIPPSADLARKKSIVDRARWIDQEDYFKMLMVGREATTEDVRAAFLRAAKVWHPDTLPLSIIDVRPDCEKVFTRINTAYETLVDPARRRVYERGVDAKMKDDAEAEQLMSQAEMHVTLGDRLQAEGLVRKALVASPEYPEAMALLAYLEALDPRKAQGEQLRNCLRMVDMAIGKDPMCKRAHYYRALFKKRLEDHEAAIRDLRIAVTNDPDDVDAQRELKVYEQKIREGSIQIRSFSPPGGVKKSEGFFDRLRKK